MPPIPEPDHLPRIVVYHQTHIKANGDFVSLLPLVTEASDSVGVTHIIIAAFHLNEAPGDITLNEHAPDNPRNERLWEEVALFQDIGVQVLGMLGGAAKGTFNRLDGDDASFESHYIPLRDVFRRHHLNGVDLDVEEDMSLAGVVRLIDRLKADFGDAFLITLAPVATALLGYQHLSGFHYETLEVMRGQHIAWYNVQFYNNWGRLHDLSNINAILAMGWPAEKVVIGVLTNPGLGHGYVEYEPLQRLLAMLSQSHPRFGGVMAWEFYSSKPGDEARPWDWAHGMAKLLRH